MSPRSIKEIQDELESTRESLTSTVDELVDRVNPRTQAKEAVECAKEKTQNLAEGVKAGDPTSLGIVGAIVGVVALVITAKFRTRKAKKTKK